jgi:hydrogenase expression/formation protein HypD
MIALTKIKNVIITTFGDMLKVPGTKSSLEIERSNGCDIRPVYSPIDALEIAKQNKNKEVVFLSVGFETTAPGIALIARDAKNNRIKNFSLYCCHKLIPPAMKAILDAKEIKIHGFLCPGHVSSIIGMASYEGLSRSYHIPCVISGFEPADILEAIAMLLRQIKTKLAITEIQYKRAVKTKGNRLAQKILAEVFRITSADWRGLGVMADSGLGLASGFRSLDAALKFNIPTADSFEPKNCECGAILRGVKNPSECKLFGKACTPEKPYGPCMVSTEGACAAWYRYQRDS